MIIRENSERFKNINQSITFDHDKDGQHIDLNQMISAQGKHIALASGNMFESLAKTNPELFNTAKLKQLKASENLAKDFKDYLDWLYDIQKGSIEEFVKEHPNYDTDYNDSNLYNATFNTVMTKSIDTDETVLRSKGISEEDIKKAIYSEYIPEAADEEAIQKILSLRIKNNKILTDSLTKMIRMNYKIFELTEAEASSLIEDLEDDETNNEGIAKIKEAFKDPKILNKFRLGNNNFDFRSVGGACIFLSSDDSIKFTQHPAKNLDRIFKYDAIIVGHGEETRGSSVYRAIEIADKQLASKYAKSAVMNVDKLNTMITNNEYKGEYRNDPDSQARLMALKQKLNSIIRILNKVNDKNLDELIDLSNQVLESINIIVIHLSDLLKTRVEIECLMSIKNSAKKINNYVKARHDPKLAMKNGSASDWTVQPIDTLQASGLDTIVDILRQLKKEGFKKIFVGACNPGGIRLPKDLANDKDFSVYYGTANVYLESIYEFPEYQSILEMECILDSALDRYGRHYEDMSVGELYMEYARLTESVITEGKITDKLKTIAKRAWEIITTIWRKVVGFIKKVLATIIEKLSKKFSKASKMKKPIKTSYIEIKNDKPVVTEVTISNTQELNKIVRDRIINLQNWAKKTLSEQDRINSKLQNELNKRKLSSTDSSVKESSFFDDIIFI